MGVPKASFKIIGTPKSYAAVGGSQLPAVRHFCPECGSLLFGTPEVVPDMVTIYAGSLDDPNAFVPEQAIFTRERPHWARLRLDVPEFETMPG